MKNRKPLLIPIRKQKDVREKFVELLHNSIIRQPKGFISLSTIPDAIKEKYNIEIGGISPFSNALIVE